MGVQAQLRSQLHELTKESAFDRRRFVLTGQLRRWLLSPADKKPSNSNWENLILELSAEHGLSAFALGLLSLDSHMKIICILVEINHVSAADILTRSCVTDQNLPLDIKRLQEIRSMHECENFPEQAVAEFFRAQWRYCPAQFDLRSSYVWEPETILPILSKRLADTGNTAQVFQIAIPEEFVGKALRDMLSWAKFKDDHDQSISCILMALKTYSGRFIQVGKNEAKVYQSLGSDDLFLGYIADYEFKTAAVTSDRSDKIKLASAATFNILLEWGDENLEEYFIHHSPPVLQSDIVSFWRSLYSTAKAIETLHNATAITHNTEGDSKIVGQHGWHGDIKPDNILVVRGKFRLSDLGLASICDSSGVNHDVPARFYWTYGAPETMGTTIARHKRSMQAIDIWSLGCVFSIAAAWVILGYDGVHQYQNLRIRDTEALVKLKVKTTQPVGLEDEEQGRLSVPGDYFHNGSKVLYTVPRFHKLLRQSARRSDNITSRVLDIVDKEMLVAGTERKGATSICNGLRAALNESEKTALNDDFEDWRDLLVAVEEPPRSVITSSPLF